jgi:hypothetical protein
MLVKLPFGPFANGSFMFRYDFQDAQATCLLSASNAAVLAHRFMEIDSLENSYPTGKSSPLDPFVILSLFLEHISAQMEDNRHDVDRQVCMLESKSGVALHNFNARGRAKITEYAIVKRDLHMLEGLLSMFEHMLSFQAELSAFLVQEHSRFSELRKEDAARRGHRLDNTSQHECIQASLRINASMAKWRLEQVQVLGRRIQIQLRVVSPQCRPHAWGDTA